MGEAPMHIRYWDAIKPTSQTRLADDVVEAILRDVFQGKRDNLRDHARAVAYKAVRPHTWPYFEECVEKAVSDRLADAWDAGMEYGIGEWGAETFASDYERNPYRPKEAKADG